MNEVREQVMRQFGVDDSRKNVGDTFVRFSKLECINLDTWGVFFLPHLGCRSLRITPPFPANSMLKVPFKGKDGLTLLVNILLGDYP